MDFVSLRRKAYMEDPNYKVIDSPAAAEPDLAVVYFSSLGTFTPDNTERRLREDYYEFHRNPVRRAGRHIYIRDVSLAFYIAGINREINNIDRLLGLLKELTAGYRVITVGVCSGGYLAMLAGAELKADYVLSLSGLCDIANHQKYLSGACPDPYGFPIGDWVRYQERGFDICPRLQASKVPVFQFEAARCESDFANAAKLARLENVRFLNIDSERHGGALSARCVGELLNRSFAQISALQQKFAGRVISQWQINRSLLNCSALAAVYLGKLRKNLFKIRFKKDRRLLIICGLTIIDREKK